MVVKKIKPNSIVLDWGCGNGRFYSLVQEKQGQYYGMDNCRLLLEKAQVQYPLAQWLSEQEEWPQKIDFIFAFASFHHLPGQQTRKEILQKFYQHLNSGGYLIMTNWNLCQRKYLWLWLKSNLVNIFRGFDFNDVLVPWRSSGKTVSRYCHNFFPVEIKNLLIANGFRVEELYYEHQGKVSNWWQGRNLVVVARKL